MKFFRHFLVTLCLPAFLLSPIPSLAFQANPPSPIENSIPRDHLGRVNPWILLQPENLSLDRYFAFIDRALQIDSASHYSEDAKKVKNEINTGVLPPPGKLPNAKAVKETTKNLVKSPHITGTVAATALAQSQPTHPNQNENLQNSSSLPDRFSIKDLCEAGKQHDREGLTRAGRALQKHGGCEGNIFPKPVGTIDKINQHGQQILEKILNDPNKRITITNEGDMEIYSSNGQGAYFRKDGKFRGFLSHEKK